MHARTQDLLNLRALPQLEPPPGVWERVLETQRVRAAARRLHRRALAAAAAVAVAMTGVCAALMLERPRAPTLAFVPHAPVSLVPREPASYAPLVAESARLERVLAELPARRVMVGSTAGTIAGLEDRIGFVDAQLSYAAARDLAPTYREALWGERVELLNALVYVRSGQ